MSPLERDLERERRIAELLECLKFEADASRINVLWAEFCKLVNARTPEQLRRMETAKGLH